MNEGRNFRQAVKDSAGGLWRRLKAVDAKQAVELMAKLAAPVAVVVGGYLAHSFQSSLTMTQLMAAREDADTKIRAEMFRAITEKLLSSKDPELSPERRAVFSELLALNFHEHFELKPLLLDVDQSLRAQIGELPQDSPQRASLVDQRYELLSVARRVRQRQTQMLIRPEGSEGAAQEAGVESAWRWFRSESREAQYVNGGVKMFSVRFGGRIPIAEGDRRVPCDLGYQEPGKRACVMEPIIENAPDGQSAIAISVIDAHWDKETITMVVKPVPRFDEAAENATLKGSPAVAAPECGKGWAPDPEGNASSSGSAVVFDISWFDMPLTDNTQLWGGSRYALFVDNICKESKGGEVVKFGLMWFPKDFFPPRERPTNYREFREKLNLTSRP